MAEVTQLSNPFSTGGGGGHFEAHVQALFVTMMLTGGCAPCLQCWPIKEIKLQGKIEGFNTDDLIVYVEKPSTKERRKLLCQVKHSIAFTKSNKLLADVLQAAWKDFNTSEIFNKNTDSIALITGSLSGTDKQIIPWLLDQAKHTKNKEDYFRNAQKANFSPPKSREKLEIIQYHLASANNDKNITQDELYEFLKRFYLLEYDLGKEFGGTLSLLFSHLSQYEQIDPPFVWSKIVDLVQTWNHDAGTITPNNLPEELVTKFKHRNVTEMPDNLKTPFKISTPILTSQYATYLGLLALLGGWNEKKPSDTKIVSQLLGISYDEWLQKAQDILNLPNSPITLRNGVWGFASKAEIWNQFAPRLLDKDIDTFSSIAISVLKEYDPVFELAPKDRFAASIYGKVFKHSRELRLGISEGLALLGTRARACTNLSLDKAEIVSDTVIHNILSENNYAIWGSLNDLLPILAEAAPNEFLKNIEKALKLSPCPFIELFSQESNGVTGRNYLTGLLWALEALAWENQFFVKTCVILGELATHDPGGNWGNRPINSLVDILLPWYPQTLVSIEKRIAAVTTLLKETPDIGWKLILQLLPNQLQSSSGTNKPKWRNVISDDFKEGVTNKEFWIQTSSYAELAVNSADHNTKRLLDLIENLSNLPEPAFNHLLDTLDSETISELPAVDQIALWEKLNNFITQHRRFTGTKPALYQDAISRIENIAGHLTPSNPFFRYRYLFTDRDYELFDEIGNRKIEEKKLNDKRDKAVLEIVQVNGLEEVLKFAEQVDSARVFGFSLGAISDQQMEYLLLPKFLDLAPGKLLELLKGYVWRRYYLEKNNWLDLIDKSKWTPLQISTLLACLPFHEDIWNRASLWLGDQEKLYWIKASVNPYQTESDLSFAVKSLLENGRPLMAIDCLDKMINDKRPFDANLCVRALLDLGKTNETLNTLIHASYYINNIIEFLQSTPSISEDILIKLEWSYLPILQHHGAPVPKTLERKLRKDPEFFCQLIRLVFRPEKETSVAQDSSEEAIEAATNGWELLTHWRTPPGLQEDGTFSENEFTDWLNRVKIVCAESGHLDVALAKIGGVLIYTPPDQNGLWINEIVAEALNDKNADSMRNGFLSGKINSRGVVSIDPMGKPELELSADYFKKADEIEISGFYRLAETLKELGNFYNKEASRIISEHSSKSNL